MSAMEPQADALSNPFMRYFLATRPAFISVTLVGCLLGMASTSYSGIPLNPLTAVITIIFAAIAHAGVNVLNDYYDALNGTDDNNQDRLYPFTGGSRFIQNGVLTPVETARYGFALLALVVPAGLWLMLHSAYELLWIGMAGLLIGWSYSAPPLKLNSRGLGELCVAAGFALIVIGADFVQRRGFSLAPVITAMPFVLLVVNILYINQFPDRRADAAAGKRHWVVRLEPHVARWGYAIIALLAHIWLVVAVTQGALPPSALFASLSLPFSLVAAHRLWRYAGQPYQLRSALQITIQAALLHGILLSVLLALSSSA